LTITAAAESITQGQTVPAFTSASAYTVIGFIPGDSLTSLNGQPSLSVVDPSTGVTVPVGSTPQAGQYSLVISQGGLVAPSYYKLTFVNGNFTVTGSNAQVVTTGRGNDPARMSRMHLRNRIFRRHEESGFERLFRTQPAYATG
jgi:hypothetical protein